LIPLEKFSGAKSLKFGMETGKIVFEAGLVNNYIDLRTRIEDLRF
jgi:hypothetical protein